MHGSPVVVDLHYLHPEVFMTSGSLGYSARSPHCRSRTARAAIQTRPLARTGRHAVDVTRARTLNEQPAKGLRVGGGSPFAGVRHGCTSPMGSAPEPRSSSLSQATLLRSNDHDQHKLGLWRNRHGTTPYA